MPTICSGLQSGKKKEICWKIKSQQFLKPSKACLAWTGTYLQFPSRFPPATRNTVDNPSFRIGRYTNIQAGTWHMYLRASAAHTCRHDCAFLTLMRYHICHLTPVTAYQNTHFATCKCVWSKPHQSQLELKSHLNSDTPVEEWFPQTCNPTPLMKLCSEPWD